jgi:hypothetical protein
MPFSKRKAAAVVSGQDFSDEDHAKKAKVEQSDSADGLDSDTFAEAEQVESDHSEPVLQQVCAEPLVISNNRDTSSVNAPLYKLDEQMHLIRTPVKDERGNSLLSIKITAKGINRYINIKYAGPPQLLLVGNNSTCYGFTKMTPFAVARYCDPLPMGSMMNMFNDKNSPKYVPNPKFPVKLKTAKFSFQLCNERFQGSEATNVEYDNFLDEMVSIENELFEQSLLQLSKQFPAQYAYITEQVESHQDPSQREMTKANIRSVFSTMFGRGVAAGKDAPNSRYIPFSQPLLRIAKQSEIEQLQNPDFKCQSGNQQITDYLKQQLTYTDEDMSKPIPRWENELKIYRILSPAERKENPDSNPFVLMTVDEQIRLMGCKKKSIVSVAYRVSLTARERSKIKVQYDPLAIVWYGWAEFFTQQQTMNNAQDIQFDFAVDTRTIV